MSLSSSTSSTDLILCGGGGSSSSSSSVCTTSSSSSNTITTTSISTQTCPHIQSSQAYLPPTSSSITSSNTSLNHTHTSIVHDYTHESCGKDWFEYLYKIDNIEDIIRSHEHTQNFIQSTTFQFKTHVLPQSKQNSNWRLIFYPNGAGLDCKNFLSIFLKYLSDEPVKIQMMFSIVNNLNEDVYVKYTVNKFQKSNDWGFKQLIHKNAILHQQEKFLKSGTLSIRIKMRLEEHKNEYLKKLNVNIHYCKLLSENFSQCIQQQQQQQQQKQQDDDEQTQVVSKRGKQSSVNDDLFEFYYDCVLLVNKNNTHDQNVDISNSSRKRRVSQDVDQDVPPSKKSSHTSSTPHTITHVANLTGDESTHSKFYAHKFILAARSPVFKAMFNHNLKENQTNSVCIADCKPEVVQLMLKYMYTATLPDEYMTFAHDLYIAAEKYFVESLKFKVREYLCDNLSVENVLQTYVLSEIYNDSMLKRYALKLISETSDKIIHTQEWDDFIKLYPQFFSNAFNSVCKKDF